MTPLQILQLTSIEIGLYLVRIFISHNWTENLYLNLFDSSNGSLKNKRANLVYP